MRVGKECVLNTEVVYTVLHLNLKCSFTRFSPATGQWNIMPALANPVGGASLVAVSNTLYVLGGSDGSAPLAACSIAQRQVLIAI